MPMLSIETVVNDSSRSASDTLSLASRTLAATGPDASREFPPSAAPLRLAPPLDRRRLGHRTAFGRWSTRARLPEAAGHDAAAAKHKSAGS